MEIIIGKHSGYCPGVKRAIKMLDEVIEKNKKSEKGENIYTFGEIIHNPNVVKHYSDKGVLVAENSKYLTSNDIVVIRSHGISSKKKKDFLDKKIKLIDTTCPFVLKVQKSAEKLSSKEFFLVIVGDKNHPEVQGIVGNIIGKEFSEFIVVESKDELKKIGVKKKLAIIAQTTQTIDNFNEIAKFATEKFKEELFIKNTICNTTILRQNEIKKIAAAVDVMIVVGGKKSANTSHLAYTAKNILKNTYHIEDISEIQKDWFLNAKKVGIYSGASTPYEELIKVKDFIVSLND